MENAWIWKHRFGIFIVLVMIGITIYGINDGVEFFIDLVTNGLLVGLMYSLVALGFVLIFKATSVINFAQGDLVMVAGYIAAVMIIGGEGLGMLIFAFVAIVIVITGFFTEKKIRPILQKKTLSMPITIIVCGGLLFLALDTISSAMKDSGGWSLWLVVPLLCAAMVGLGFILERGILRPLVGQPVISVIMVTIGLTFALQGLSSLLWGADTLGLVLPVPEDPIILGPVFLSPLNLVAAGIAIFFLIAFGLFFTRSRLGVAMRAVADDQQAAMVVGIKVPKVFALSWAISGLAAGAGGLIWGNMLGVDTLLATIGLKVFPIVILGGLESIVGAILGGLIIGAIESLTAGYFDPLVGGGTKDFIPYVLMILVLFIKPYGMFGHETIERV